MPRIFKGTETLLKLFVPRVDEGNLETLKIGLFTDDTNNAVEFYGDNMSIDGDTVYLRVNAWSFDSMNEGVLNYVAEIEIGDETIITERQSNYFLKTPNQYKPATPEIDVDLDNYYTKPEIDEMLEDIEVDVDLTGYATEQYVNDAIANIEIPEGGSGVYILEGIEPIFEAEFWYHPETGEFEMIYEKNDEYSTSEERKAHNKKVIDAIFEGKCKSLYYKKFVGNVDEEVIEVDENGREHRKTVNGYQYYPLSWTEYEMNWGEINHIRFEGKFIEGYMQTPRERVIVLNKETAEVQEDSTMSYAIGNFMDMVSVSFIDEYKMERRIYDVAISNPKPVCLNIEGDGTTSRCFLKTKYKVDVETNTEQGIVWCDDVDGNRYTWVFEYNFNDGTYNDYAIPTITPIASGGGSTPSTETDSGVYVLESNEDYWLGEVMYTYDGSERKEHNKKVYQAYKEGKIKMLSAKRFDGERNGNAVFDIIPLQIRESNNYDNSLQCFGIWEQCGGGCVFTAQISVYEDGNIDSYFWNELYPNYIDEVSVYVGRENELDYDTIYNACGNMERFILIRMDKGEDEMYYKKYAANLFYDDYLNNFGCWTVLEDRTIYKWTFNYNENDGTYPCTFEAIPMEFDSSSYYTKEEVDGLIANINLGDGATIENIVANEVANQLTDNFKTINGESILGEGDITIEGGGDVDLSNYYTKEETNNLIANSGGGSGDLSYVTITSPTIVGEMTFNDKQLPHVDISESVYCNFKARTTQSKDLWVNNIHIGTNTDTVKIASPYYEATENMPDGAQEVYAEFTKTGIKEMGQYLSDKYVLKSEISATIQRLSGENLIGEEVYDFWQKNIPIWMDYHGYDRNNGNIYTAYAPLHIYKPLANGTELKVYMWITPNIYVEWQLDINNNDSVHGIITVKE